MRKRKKVNDAIDENLELLLNDHKNGLITSMQLAIKCGLLNKQLIVENHLFIKLVAIGLGDESRVTPNAELGLLSTCPLHVN